jgi:3-oxoacyl-[acyl-carrier protein] reductase
MNTSKLSGRVAIVTGASKGIGACIAKALAKEGASVVVNYSSSQEAADRVVAEITSGGGQAVAVKANVAKSADIAHLFAETQAAFGRLDILVNNAGIYQPGPIGTITEESFHAHFNLNVLGLILASQEAVKQFGPEGGVIVNISSVVALVTPPGITVYNATKGAVDSVTRSFARELADKKIRVNAINPGLIATEGTHATGFVVEGSDESPLGPVGKPENIASIVTFLASDDSKWINGQVHYATGKLL